MCVCLLLLSYVDGVVVVVDYVDVCDIVSCDIVAGCAGVGGGVYGGSGASHMGGVVVVVAVVDGVCVCW